MKSTIAITPVTNIKNFAVIDNSKVEKRTYDSDKDNLIFFSTKSDKKRTDTLINVSLYDDLLIEGEVKYKILTMLSK